MHITATELKNNLGQYLAASNKGPIVVEKSGKPAAVVISYSDYKKFEDLEDLIWGLRAQLAEQEGYLGTEESHQLLAKHAKKIGLDLEKL